MNPEKLNTNEITLFDEYIDKNQKCSLCGSELKFVYETDFVNLKVQEEARCPECCIRNKVQKFSLH